MRLRTYRRLGDRAACFYHGENSSFANFISDGNRYFHQFPGDRCRNIHGRFIAFQGDQAVLGGDLRSRGSKNVDDIYFLKIANVRDRYFYQASGACLRRRRRCGFASGFRRDRAIVAGSMLGRPGVPGRGLFGFMS